MKYTASSADPFHRQLDHAGRLTVHHQFVAVLVSHQRGVVEQAHLLGDAQRVRREVPRGGARADRTHPGDLFQGVRGAAHDVALRLVGQWSNIAALRRRWSVYVLLEPSTKAAYFGGGESGGTGTAAPQANATVAASPPMDLDRKGTRFNGLRAAPMHGRSMIAMHRVWTRIAAVANYTGVEPALTKEIAKSEAALAAAPDSREKHRALVQALSYAGELDRAKRSRDALARARPPRSAGARLPRRPRRPRRRARAQPAHARRARRSRSGSRSRCTSAWSTRTSTPADSRRRAAIGSRSRRSSAASLAAAGAARCLRMIGRDERRDARDGRARRRRAARRRREDSRPSRRSSRSSPATSSSTRRGRAARISTSRSSRPTARACRGRAGAAT